MIPLTGMRKVIFEHLGTLIEPDKVPQALAELPKG